LQVFKGLRDPDEDVRKLSARLLCDLAYQNEGIQGSLCEFFDFTPICGKVCISELPSKVLTLGKRDLLALLKKPVSESKRYWCFPPLDQGNYQASLDHFTLFPDPAQHAVGFVVTTGKGDREQDTAQFLNTTTSYLSDDLSSDSFTSTSPYSSRDYAIRTEVKSITEKRPALRAYIPPAAPTCIQTRPSQSPARLILTDRQREPSPLNRTFQSIEVSIQRIRGCLSRCRPVLHALNSKSPPRKAAVSPLAKTRASVMAAGRFRSMEVGDVGRRSPRCSTERTQD